MPNYRRAYLPGGTFFFTVVTYQRRPILIHEESRRVLREVIQKVRQRYPFTIVAWVLLPEHLHCLWTLPEGDYDFSLRWNLIKSRFSRHVRPLFYKDAWITDSKKKHRESTIWQRRFWEHRIRDENDYRRHMDYIHYNPLKHGLVSRVVDWPYSTFHRYVHEQVYPANWGSDVSFDDKDEFGEIS